MGNFISRGAQKKSQRPDIFSAVIILRHIFGFLSFAELLQARLICSHWRNVANEELRSRLSHQISVRLFNSSLIDPLDAILSLAKIDPTYRLPFTNILVQARLPVLRQQYRIVVPKQRNYNNLYRIICKSVIILTIDFYKHVSMIWPPAGAKHPHLRMLVLNFFYCSDLPAITFNVKNFSSVIKTAPCLDAISVECPKELENHNFIYLLLGKLQASDVQKIKHLYLYYIHSGDLVNLKDIPLELESLSVHFKIHDGTVAVLKQILNCHNKILQTLEIGLFEAELKTKHDWLAWFVLLEKVKILRIKKQSDFFPSSPNIPCGPSESFYGLELSQDRVWCVGRNEFTHTLLKNIIGLKMPYSLCEQGNENFNILPELGQTFSNINQLAIFGCAIKTLAPLIKDMSNLKHLNIRGRESQHTLGNLERFIINSATQNNVAWLSCLEGLETLTFEWDYKLTDRTFHILLPYFKHLRCLDLWENMECKLSQGLVQQMRNTFSVYIHRECIITRDTTEVSPRKMLWGCMR